MTAVTPIPIPALTPVLRLVCTLVASVVEDFGVDDTAEPSGSGSRVQHLSQP